MNMLTHFSERITNYLDDNNIQYTINNCLLYSVLNIPHNNIKIYNYYFSNYYMFYKNDKYLYQCHGKHLYFIF